MANCPKCNAHLRISDWKQHCPHCGANIVMYDLQERLMLDADKAEVQNYHFQKKIDRLKGAFIGSKLAIARIVTSILPIGAIFLPLISGRISEPLVPFEGGLNLLKLIDVAGSLNINAVLELLKGSEKSPALGMIIAIILFAIAVLSLVLHFLGLMLACSKKAKARGIIFNAIMLGSTIGSIISFATISSNSFIDAKLGIGAFLFLALMLANSAVDITVLFFKPITITHKQCYVGGIPIEEYFEMQKKGIPHEEIRKEMYKRLNEMQQKMLEELENSNSSAEAEKIEEKGEA